MAVRQNPYQRNDNRSRRSYANTYIDGNVVRQIEAAPKRTRQELPREVARKNIRRNREKSQRVNLPYVAFLTVVSITTVFVCVNYLRLQADGISYRSEIAGLESNLSSLKLANDNAYENAISSVDMEQVKYIAINELGMEYADEGQVITYSNEDGDYIRQYAEIPAE
ncbi:MAG: hypothetical protein Q4B57_05405 [Eubacteriales bacterium]|nr:hypothetical protein [Eubacteriales bacterium]